MQKPCRPVCRMIALMALFSLLGAPLAAGEDIQWEKSAAADLAVASSLPVLYLTTDTGDMPTDDDARGQLVVLTGEDGAIRTLSAVIEINERGNTSRRFQKKSFRVKIVRENGGKANFPLAGLRSDDDWILNPLYTDTSKIREALAYDLWGTINSSGEIAATSRMAYAEVFLNGQYHGLYGVQERIDRKQVSGDKRQSVLYKVATNDRPTADELLSSDAAEVFRAFEIAYVGTNVREQWRCAADYMATLDGMETTGFARLSQANVIDYGLWAMLAQAHDCHFKNQFLHCVYGDGGYTMYKIPWDLNNTFGDIWQNDAADTNYTGYHAGKLVMDGAFELLVQSGDDAVYQAIQARWAQLRAGDITQENLIARAHALYDPLFDAIDRDSERWPECGMGEGNARNIRDIEAYIRQILPRMDDYIARLREAE